MAKINFYDAAIFKIHKNFDDFLKIYIQASKGLISTELDIIREFPQSSCITNVTNHFTIDFHLFEKCIKSFDETLEIEDFLISMMKTAARKNIIKESTSKSKLFDKRKFQKLLVEDLLILANSKKLNLEEFKRALRLFSYTLNSAFLAFPPGRIAKTTFEKWTHKISIQDKKLLLTVYKLVDDFYCNQGRISKKNFRELNRIIFNLKHCES